MSEPKWQRDLREALEKVGAAFEHAHHVILAQAAMGHMFRGELEQARDKLAELPPEKLTEVSVAAAALASLADEVAGEAKAP
ncbi:hypothetical protein [Actinoallomurus sp. NPDC052274]|uniref:hypothetical protein n=1 Tax=Actinoallomurus sp. NPDC052274 TaxID=3155420 RepID=UPI003433CE6C